MKLWIDDVRPAPEGYIWLRSVNEAKRNIAVWEYQMLKTIEVIDIDHDAGDYIKLLDWLEMMGLNYPIHIHSMNPVGIANMRTIIERNGWMEVG